MQSMHNAHGFIIGGHEHEQRLLSRIYIYYQSQYYMGVMPVPLSRVDAEEFKNMRISSTRSIFRVICNKMYTVLEDVS